MYIPVYPDGGIALVKQLKDAGIPAAKILGAETFNDPKFLADTKGSADNIIITASEIPLSESFKQKMAQKTGQPDVPICAPQAYDAAQVLIGALKVAGVDGDKLSDAVRATSIVGESGKISFDKNGDPTTANFVVKKIVGGTLVAQ